MNKIPKVELVEWFDDHFYRIDYYDETLKLQTRYIPSVTTKLGAVAKPFLTRWYGDLGTREAQMRVSEAADRGSRVHYAWFVYRTGGVVLFQPLGRVGYSSDEIRALEEQYKGNMAILQHQGEMYDLYKLQLWTNAVKPRMEYSEKIVYSLTDNDAGTVDGIDWLEAGSYSVNESEVLKIEEQGYYIIDLKTGNYVGNEAKMQVAEYAKCVDHMELPIKITGAIILHTSAKNKKGIPQFNAIYLNRQDIETYYQQYREVAKVWESQFGNLKPKVFAFPKMITKGE